MIILIFLFILVFILIFFRGKSSFEELDCKWVNTDGIKKLCDVDTEDLQKVLNYSSDDIVYIL